VRTRQRLAAYALITDSEGRVLLAGHPDEGRGTGRWLLPGGGVEHGEHPEQAAVREIREETGLAATVGGLLTVLSDTTRPGRRRRALHNVRLVYLASIVQAEPGRPDGRPEMAAQPPVGYARWCTPQEWQALPLTPFTAQVLRAVRD